MKDFVFENSTRVYFGRDCVSRYLPEILKGYGPNVMLGYGSGSIRKNGIYDTVISVLRDSGKNVIEFRGIMSNPTYEKMMEGRDLAREFCPDLILAVGGGSVMDCCKAIAMTANYDGDPWDEYWARKGKISHELIPLGIIVTAAATGSEVNGGAVLTDTETGIKTDIDYPEANARFSLLDPVYTMSVSARQLRAGSFDILSHIMETYFSGPDDGNVSDDISEALMRNTIASMRKAIEDPEDYQARSNLMWDSSMAENRIIKLGKDKDFQAHNMEHQLSAFTDCNHGEGLAVLHPVYYRHIYKDGLEKFVRFARNVWGIDQGEMTDDEMALAGIDALEKFIRDCGLPGTLTDLGITDRDILRKAADSSGISQGAYRQLTKDEIYQIFLECL